MKKLYLFLALILMAGSISAQRMVQGVLRSDLPAEKQKAALMSARSNRTFSFDSIDFWVGDGENRAAIVLLGMTRIKLYQIIWFGDIGGLLM